MRTVAFLVAILALVPSTAHAKMTLLGRGLPTELRQELIDVMRSVDEVVSEKKFLEGRRSIPSDNAITQRAEALGIGVVLIAEVRGRSLEIALRRGARVDDR